MEGKERLPLLGACGQLLYLLVSERLNYTHSNGGFGLWGPDCTHVEGDVSFLAVSDGAY